MTAALWISGLLLLLGGGGFCYVVATQWIDWQ